MNKKPEMNLIYDSLVQVANAIASVLNVDVLIVDTKLNRIVATGESAYNQGEKIDEGSVFAYALKHGESFIIDSPRTHAACQFCKNKDTCIEFAEVCCPIRLDKDILGVIGLIAFNEKQREMLLANKENIMAFLYRMSELIASKMVENRKTDQILRMAEEMTALFDSIDRGVVSLNEDGYILRFNDKAKGMFKLDRSEHIHIREIIGFDGFEQLIRKKGIKNASVSSQNDLGTLYSARPFYVEKRAAGYVILFEEVEGVIETYNKIINRKAETGFDDILGKSRILEQVKKDAEKASASSSTILIQGESGTGKELFARAIHQCSKRKNESFVPINCAAIPEHLLESELFGYEEGAFTGARKGGRIGKFEQANKGTLFLDEIGDMSMHLQSKLLRVLQDGRIDRIGGKETIAVDVRIIAATHQKLEEKVKLGEFREDLFYRLNVIPLRIPTLRERTDDIVLLADHFLTLSVEKMNKKISGFKMEVLDHLKQYNWPGNVRELENAIEYAVNMTSDRWLEMEDLPERIRVIDTSVEVLDEEIKPIAMLEKEEILKAIQKFGRSRKGVNEAASALGISRATIYRRLKE